MDKPHTTPARSISLWIDGYDDIFSDFDPRPYSEKNISDDFLLEVKKICSESELPVNEIKLEIPGKSRNDDSEKLISKRLHHHFRTNYTFYQNRVKDEVKRGWRFIFWGVLLMVGAAVVHSSDKANTLYFNILFILFEPGGWFLTWTGFDILIKQRRKETGFDSYKNMKDARVVFVNR